MASNANLRTQTFRAGTWGTASKIGIPYVLGNPENIGAESDLIILPRGLKLLDAYIIPTVAATASTTANIGLKGLNGTTQDDVDYFFALVTLVTLTALIRKTTPTPPLVLTDDTYLRLTVAGANNVIAGAAGLIVLDYEYVGE